MATRGSVSSHLDFSVESGGELPRARAAARPAGLGDLGFPGGVRLRQRDRRVSRLCSSTRARRAARARRVVALGAPRSSANHHRRRGHAVQRARRLGARARHPSVPRQLPASVTLRSERAVQRRVADRRHERGPSGLRCKASKRLLPPDGAPSHRRHDVAGCFPDRARWASRTRRDRTIPRCNRSRRALPSRRRSRGARRGRRGT